MSSLRNAVKRITHKERSQPQARAHLGILEKKKDYQGRARDYHRKEDRIKAMRKRASERNPDEFYFGMHNAQVGANGKHGKTEDARRTELEEDGLGDEAVKIMKDQDLSYIRMLRMKDGKKIERLQSSLHYLDGGAGKKRKHTVFVEGGKKAVENFDAAEHFDTLPELTDRAFNRPRLEALKKAAAYKAGHGDGDSDDDYYENGESGKPTKKKKQLSEKQLQKKAIEEEYMRKRIARSRSQAYTEMEQRNERMAKLENAEAHLIVQKQQSMKGRKRKIKGAEDGKPAVFKWSRKRAK